jgi:stress-induced morphogen
MIPLNKIEEKIKNKINTSFIRAIDLRGGDHIQLILVSPDFEGKMLVEQHKAVYEVLNDELKSNEIHALTLKKY